MTASAVVKNKKQLSCLGTKSYSISQDDDGDFSSLGSALNAAEQESVPPCSISLFVNPGTYTAAALTIKRATTIVGMGKNSGQVKLVTSITNNSPVALTLENLKLQDSPYPGAVVALHAKAKTTLKNISISKASGCGVRVHSGTLVATTVAINETQFAGKLLGDGSALCLIGAAVDLDGVSLYKNGLHGLFQSGGTLTALNLFITDTQCDATLLSKNQTACGGFHLEKQAVADFDGLWVYDNTWLGGSIKASEASFYGAYLGDTIEPDTKSGGGNLAVWDSDSVAITDFEITNGFAGLFLYNSCVDMKEGNIHQNDIGLVYGAAGEQSCELEDLLNPTVTIHDNTFKDIYTLDEEMAVDDQPIETPTL